MCVWVAWINGKGGGEGPVSEGGRGPVSVGFLSFSFFLLFCGADGGSRIRYLRLGVVVFRRLSYVVSNGGRGLRS